MLFNSIDFLLFFVAVFGLYLLLPHRGQNYLLLAASFLFYGSWDYRFLLLMTASIITDFTAGRFISKADSVRSKKIILATSISIELGILGFFKYFNFFIGSAEEFINFVGFESLMSNINLNIVLPVGISFYTFQCMSYSIDVYRGQLKPTDDLVSFALFVSFFPQLVAGPIERASRLLPQVLSPRKMDAYRIREGGWLILNGLFVKMVVADNLSVIVDRYFENQAIASWADGMLAIYAFSFQILCDFAGYSDIARGTARLLGFDLMTNFRNPYLALDPSDFWRRWHISLSSWLRDYLYIPLGGNRKGANRARFNLMITMLLGGLWHGAAWTFVCWGLYHGGLLVLFKVLDLETHEQSRLPAWRVFLQRLIFYHLICLGWLFFRAENFGQVMTFFNSFNLELHVSPGFYNDLLAAGLLIAPIFGMQYLTEYYRDQYVVFRLSALPRAMITGGMIILISLVGYTDGNAFIYFQF